MRARIGMSGVLLQESFQPRCMWGSQMCAEGVRGFREMVLSDGRELMNVLERQRFPPHPQLLDLTIFKSFLGACCL